MGIKEERQQNDCKIRLALIGLGNQGREHLSGAKTSHSVEFVAGVDVGNEQRQRVRQNYPSLNLFASVKELADQAKKLKLDGLVLCLPHHQYGEVWKDIVGIRLPVLKEKPLARHLDEAIELTTQLSQLKTAVQRRYHPTYRHLKECLRRDNAKIQEMYGWLHLGKSLPLTQDDSSRTEKWRENKANAGGGILLDAGYHLVDLAHFLVGNIELINCTTWVNKRRSGPGELEDEAQLLAAHSNCWVMLDVRLGGMSADGGSPQKSEGIELQTDQGRYFANRQVVKKNDEVIPYEEHRSDWEKAMGQQLDEFAQNIRENKWVDSHFWDQIPAMQLIERAYQLASWF